MEGHKPHADESSPIAPENEWYAHCPGACEPQRDLVLSEARAVQEALARLGPRATSAQVQEQLRDLGITVSLSTIEKIRAELGHP